MRQLLSNYRHVIGYTVLAITFFVYYFNHRNQCSMYERFSEEDVLMSLSDSFDFKAELYFELFTVCEGLVNSFDWDTIEHYSYKVGVPDTLNPKVNIQYNSRRSIGLTISSDIVFFTGDSINQDEQICKMLGLKHQQVIELNQALQQANHNYISIYRDGTISVEYHVGPTVLNSAVYELVKPGPNMHIYGNYLPVGEIMIGKKT
ncbi:MAG: hypothetical protein ACI9JN_000232 [Bacteroidia bacterium]|jgi:hypothetical protein